MLSRVSTTLRTRAPLASRGFAIKVGDSVPNVELGEGAPGTTVAMGDATSKGKHIIVGVPGAFTPVCSKSHIPSFISNFDAIKAKGVENIFCVSVNDIFVTEAWKEALGASGKVRVVADPGAQFVGAMDLSFSVGIFGGLPRSKRFAMVVEDGKVKHLEVEPDNTGDSCTLGSHILEKL